MLLDGHTDTSQTHRPGQWIPTLVNRFYRWDSELLQQVGPVASSLKDRIQQHDAELLRATGERDIRILNQASLDGK